MWFLGIEPCMNPLEKQAVLTSWWATSPVLISFFFQDRGLLLFQKLVPISELHEPSLYSGQMIEIGFSLCYPDLSNILEPFLFTLCVGVLPALLLHVHAWCPWRPGKDVCILGLELESCEPYVCYELNLGSLQEQQVLSTATAPAQLSFFEIFLSSPRTHCLAQLA